MGIKKGEINVVLGLQRGDEGKGRFVDELAKDHDIVARFNGGPNAGHTVVLPDDTELDLHLAPSGIAHSGVVNIIGNGCLIDPVKLLKEFSDIESKGIKISPKNLKISLGAHLILPSHIEEDKTRESGSGAQGSTASGIAQVARDKYSRTGLTLEQAISMISSLDQPKEFIDAIRLLEKFATDTTVFINQQLESGKKVLAEGAQAFLLDIDHGMYPFVTSSNTTIGGVCTGLGVSPRYINKVIGVVKATQSHVGGGPFVTEITDEKLLEQLRGKKSEVDGEFGTTTGRARRMGHLDLPQIRRSIMINGITEVAITKVDCISRYGNKVQICTKYSGDVIVAPASASELEKSEPIYESLSTWDEDISSLRSYDDLPEDAKKYIDFIKSEINTPITRIGVGPNRNQVIKLTDL